MAGRAIEHRKFPPAAPRSMYAFEFAGNPASLVVRSGELDNANLFAFWLIGCQHLLRKVRADRVLPDNLRGHAQNIWSRPVILGKGYAELRGILALPPLRKPFDKQFETSEGSPPKTVDGLIVVAHCEDILGFVHQQFEQPQLC